MIMERVVEGLDPYYFREIATEEFEGIAIRV